MLIQKMVWWLWNQMFQYAYIKGLSLKNKTDFKLDITEYKTYKLHKYSLKCFNLENKYSKKNEIPFYENVFSNNKYINFLLNKIKWIIKRLNKNHFIEKQLNFDKDFFKIKYWYIEWYFSTEKYFIDFEDEIRNGFKFNILPSKKNKEIMNIINSCNSISVHIRRWDYVDNKKIRNIYQVCNLDYYNKAINLIKSKVDNPIFFFFSNDIEWVKQNLKIDYESYYIDWNNADTNYEDMRLMSLCKHNIIPNSTFSWWWAWLNNNKEKIVIAPKKWFNNTSMNYTDIVPDKWIKI